MFVFSISFYYSQLPCGITTNGLVGHWPFNGNADDESGNGNHGIVNGSSLTEDRFGNYNSAYNFDGDDWIKISNGSLLQDNYASYSIWFKSDTNYLQSLMLKANIYTNSSGSNPLPDNEVLQFAINEGPQQNTSFFRKYNSNCQHTVGWVRTLTNSPNYGNYHHLVSVVKNDSIFLYLDGELKNFSVSPNNMIDTCNSPLYFGRDWTDLYNFVGELDDIAIWNRALDINEINLLYNNNNIYYDTVVVYDTISIAVTDTLIINLNITDINSAGIINTIKVYPNPTNDFITIDNGDYNSMNGYTLNILNSQGQNVYTSNINSPSTNTNVSQLGSAGTYFLQIIDNSGVIIEIRYIILN